jgi:hypothetical protein
MSLPEFNDKSDRIQFKFVSGKSEERVSHITSVGNQENAGIKKMNRKKMNTPVLKQKNVYAWFVQQCIKTHLQPQP